jgi:hypothetical protein
MTYSELTIPPGFGSSVSCEMTSIRMAALAALFVSTGGMSTALAQPAAGLLENPPENMRLFCRPVTIRQAGAAVRLWRCPPRVTSALSPAAPRGVSNAEPDSVYAANENWSQGEGARTSDTARGESRGSAGGTRTADGSPVTGISDRGFTIDGGTSSSGVNAGGGAGTGGATNGAGGGAGGGSGSEGGSSGPGPGNPGNDKGVGNSGEKHGEHAGGQGSRGASDIGGHGHDGSRGNGSGNGSNNGHGGDNGRGGEGHGGR